MVRTQIQMTEEQVRKLKKMASVQHISMAELIRQAVDDFILARGGVDFEERKKCAIAAAGRFHSGIHNLSEAHDEHYRILKMEQEDIDR